MVALALALSFVAFAQDVAFFPAVPYPLASLVSCAAGDFDLDGDEDLAAVIAAPESIRFLVNQGDGTFADGGSFALPAGCGPSHVAITDADYDGDIDLAVALASLDRVRLLLNEDAQFHLGPSSDTGDDPGQLVVRDVDRNGKQDIAVLDRAGDTVTLQINFGGHLPTYAETTYPAGLDPREIDVADVTDDGLADVVVAAHASRSVELLVNTGNGFAPAPPLSLGAARPTGIAIADLDGDSLEDIAVSVTDGGVESVAVFLAAADGTFNDTGARYALGGAGSCSLVAADLDSDLEIDLAAALTGSGEIAVISGGGDGTFSAPARFAAGVAPSQLLVARIDPGASPDLLAVDPASGAAWVLVNRAIAGWVQRYCEPKVTSLGVPAQITWDGPASVAANDLVIRLVDGIPGAPSIAYCSRSGASSAPFQGGTMCVRPPVRRLAASLADELGAASWDVPVEPSMVGETLGYQVWFRDPDGSFGTGLTDALEVTFGP